MVVDMAPDNESDSFGRQVVIDHGDGFCTQYAHLEDDGSLRPGSRVHQGARVGTVGRTGSVPPYEAARRRGARLAIAPDAGILPIDASRRA